MEGLGGLGSESADFLHAGGRVLWTTDSEGLARHEDIQGLVIRILAGARRVSPLVLLFSPALFKQRGGTCKLERRLRVRGQAETGDFTGGVVAGVVGRCDG